MGYYVLGGGVEGDFIFTFKRKVDSIQREEWDEKKLQRTLDLRGKGS